MDIFDEIHTEAQRARAERLPRAPLHNPGSAPAGVQKVIDKRSAQAFYEFAGDNPGEARKLAVTHGWRVQ